MHHISVGVFLCRPWLLWRWLTWCGRTPTACRYPVRHANSSTHASLLWQLGQNDSLLSLYLLEREHVDLSMSLSHLRILLTSDSSDIPVVPVHYKYSISHLESSRSSVFTPQFAHLHSEIFFFFSGCVHVCISSWQDSNDGSFLVIREVFHGCTSPQTHRFFPYSAFQWSPCCALTMWKQFIMRFNCHHWRSSHFSSPLIPRWWFISAFVTCHS